MRTFSFRWLQVLLGLLISIRVIGRLLLSPSFFVPDESTWSRLTEWITAGGDKTVFEGFDRTPYYGAQALIIPSSFQVEYFGISSLDAVRNTSLIYGIGCLIVIYQMFRQRVREAQARNVDFKPRYFAIFSICLLIYGLLPSHFLWSILGLRDSVAEFFVMLTFLLIQKSLYSNTWRVVSIPLMLLSSSLVFSARYQTGWIVCTLLVAVGFFSNWTKSRRLELCLIGICAFLVGTHFSQAPETVQLKRIVVSEGELSLVIKLLNSEINEVENNGLGISFDNEKLSITRIQTSLAPVSQSTDSPNIDFIKLRKISYTTLVKLLDDVISSDPTLKIEISTYEVSNSNFSGNLTQPVQKFTSLENERKAKRVDAQGVIGEIECPIATTGQVSLLICEIFRIPGSLSSFLFRPFVWETPTSQEFRYASLENISWLVGFMLIAYLLIKMRKRLSRFDLASLAFIFLFSVPASLTEGNFGTAVRHKSVVLWALIYLLFSMTYQLKTSTTHREVLGSKETEKQK